MIEAIGLNDDAPPVEHTLGGVASAVVAAGKMLAGGVPQMLTPKREKTEAVRTRLNDALSAFIEEVDTSILDRPPVQQPLVASKDLSPTFTASLQFDFALGCAWNPIDQKTIPWEMAHEKNPPIKDRGNSAHHARAHGIANGSTDGSTDGTADGGSDSVTQFGIDDCVAIGERL